MRVLEKKPTPKRKLWGVLFLGFFAKAVKWLATLPSSAAGSSRRKLSYCSRAIGSQAIIGRAIVGRAIMSQAIANQAIAAQTIVGWAVKGVVSIKKKVVTDRVYLIIPQVIFDWVF